MCLCACVDVDNLYSGSFLPFIWVKFIGHGHRSKGHGVMGLGYALRSEAVLLVSASGE